MTVDDLWDLLARSTAPWWALPLVALLTALLTQWLTSRRDDRTRNQQAAAEAAARVAGLAVHLAPLIDGARELRRELAVAAVPDQRRQVASRRLRELGAEMLGLQRDFYQAQAVSNLLVPGADPAMSKLFETLELNDATTTDPLDLDAVQRAATTYLAEARKTLKIRGGEQRAWWRRRATHES